MMTEFRNNSSSTTTNTNELVGDHSTTTTIANCINPSPPLIRNSAFSRPIRNGLDPLPADPPPIPAGSHSTSAYRECLRNHAASAGGHVIDGCCEFMPDAADPLRCAACACHRSFHRKAEPFYGASNGLAPGRVQRPVPLLLPPPHPTAYQPSPPGGAAAARSGGTATTQSSSSEERGELDPDPGAAAAKPGSRKRFRTKFTADQKERMLAFAERVGWRVRRQEEAEVERFCREVGINRQVLKVWMHNNKHNNLRKQQQLLQSSPLPQPSLQLQAQDQVPNQAQVQGHVVPPHPPEF